MKPLNINKVMTEKKNWKEYYLLAHFNCKENKNNTCDGTYHTDDVSTTDLMKCAQRHCHCSFS